MALPSGYKELAYIGGTGTQYIDLGVNGNLNTRFEVKVNKVTASSKNSCTVFGDISNTSAAISVNVSMGTTSNSVRFGNKSISLSKKYSEYALACVYRLDKTGLYTAKYDYSTDSYINSETITDFNGGVTTEFTTKSNLYLFRSNGSGSDYIDGVTRIFWAKLYDGETLIRDLIPALKIDTNSLGMYDLVNDTFYVNAGTDDFIPPEKIKYLNYIESTGTQYIDTLIKAGTTSSTTTLPTVNDIEVYSNMMWIESPGSTAGVFAGVQISSGNSQRYFIYGQNDKWAWNYQGQRETAEKSIEINILYEVASWMNPTDQYGDTCGCLIDGTNILDDLSIAGTPTTSTRNLYLFANNGNGTANYFTKTRLYDLTIFKGSGIDAYKSFSPAQRESDGAIGLYDIINYVFYENAGTGEFKYGCDVTIEQNYTDGGTVTGEGSYDSGSSVSLSSTINDFYDWNNWKLNGYTKLDYIESNLNSSGLGQYIDTGVSPASYLNTLRIEADMAFSEQPTGATSQYLFGSGYYNSTAASRRTIAVGYRQASSTTQLAYLNGTQWNTIVTFTESTLDTNRHIFGIDQVSGLYIFDDKVLNFSTTINSNLIANLVIFAARDSSSSGIPIKYFAKVKCYGFKIYNNDTLIRNYIPAKRNLDGEIGLLDLCDNKFYVNSSDYGNFSYGQELQDEITITNNPYSFTIWDNLNFTANYIAGHKVIIDEEENCTIKYEVNKNNSDIVTLWCIPDQGYKFDRLVINGVDSFINPITLTLTGDVIVSGYSSEISYEGITNLYSDYSHNNVLYPRVNINSIQSWEGYSIGNVSLYNAKPIITSGSQDRLYVYVGTDKPMLSFGEDGDIYVQIL